MQERPSRREYLKEKLLHKYRMVILNEDTFEERLSFKLTRLNVFVVAMLLALLLVVGTTFLIALTPLKEYIPGYDSTELRQTAATNIKRIDTLENELRNYNQILQNMRNVLTGDIPASDLERDALSGQLLVDPAEMGLSPNKQDSILRAQVAQEDRYNLFESAQDRIDIVLFEPARGSVTQDFDLRERHYGIDVALKKGTPVKVVGDGTVIHSEWGADTGYTIIVKHRGEMLSVYKHNGALIKQQGDLVKAGEVIATSGNTGELTTGPHLHFELWKDGYPMNPTHFIRFEE